MKKTVFFLFALFLFSCQKEKSQYSDAQRQNVVFILGEDTDESNHYYEAATAFYLTQDTDNQQIVNKNCRSLTEVVNYLNQSKQSFRNITLVAHGNEWTGLKVPIFQQTKERTTASTLKKAMKNNAFQKIKGGIIDEKTTIMIQGCAIGKDKDLLSALRDFFGGNVIIQSPEQFVVYQANHKMYLADYFYAFQHPDSLFSQNKILTQWQKNYPNEKTDWQTVLTQTKTNDPEKPFVYRFKIPIHWTITFENEAQRPIFSDTKAFQNWLFSQEKVLLSLQKTNLDPNFFRWKYSNIMHTLDNGKSVSAIKIDGLCQVICALKPLK